jgi:hypothetical protein
MADSPKREADAPPMLANASAWFIWGLVVGTFIVSGAVHTDTIIEALLVAAVGFLFSIACFVMAAASAICQHLRWLRS